MSKINLYFYGTARATKRTLRRNLLRSPIYRRFRVSFFVVGPCKCESKQMVIFAGKLIFGTKFEFHSRLLLIPWVKWSSSIRSCSNSSSSLPVRYIPKKPSKTNELQTSSPPVKGYENKRINSRASRFEGDARHKCLDQSSRLPPLHGSEDKEMCTPSDSSAPIAEFSDAGKSLSRGFVLEDRFQNGNRQREPCNSLIFNAKSEIGEDNDCKEGVEYEFMEEPKVAVEELKFHQIKDAHKQLEYEFGKTRQEVEKIAVKLLATRAFTGVQLKKKLLGKKYPLDIVDAVIAEFQSRGFINDLLYAETFSRSRWSSSSWGPRRIKKALSEKGVNKGDAEKATKLVFEDGESDDDRVSGLGLSKLSMDHLVSQASKQWLRGQDVPIEKRKSRIIRWLQYRGFDWGVVSFVLKKLQSQNPP